MIKGLKAMLAHGDDDICIEDAIRQIEHHVDCIVQDPSYEIPKNVFRLRVQNSKLFRSENARFQQLIETGNPMITFF